MTTGHPGTQALLPSRNHLSRYLALVEQLPGWRKIGDILVDLGLVTAEQIQAGLKAQRRFMVSRATAVGLLDALQELDLLTPQQAQQALDYQITQCYLPSLIEALASRDRALEELRATYQRSLQIIAGYVEEAASQHNQQTDLQAQIARLEGELASARRQLRETAKRNSAAART